MTMQCIFKSGSPALASNEPSPLTLHQSRLRMLLRKVRSFCLLLPDLLSGSLSSWIHTDEAKEGTEDRKEHGTPTSTWRQQRGEEHEQVKAAGIRQLAVFPWQG